ncbi:hypothetical protein K1T71_000862 [Dendrolimus kikuchii]|uniref:Uncharacterized protein n=1 Tax=Dendrolimus kikuchii TaxID=765133 RepID=A0ACC1DG96_9NEOP|nr:hypothetical protein K1T71_000862 [Dendrolimus kikuchii]
MFVKLDIFLIIILNMLIDLINGGRNKNLVINKKGLEKVDSFSVGLMFFVDLNNTSSNDINLEIKNGQCCLKNGDNIDCETLELIGCTDTIPGGTSKTINLVAPILGPVQRKGYCIAHIDTWGVDKRKMRNPIKLNFDIKLKEFDSKKPVNICSTIDQDPLNDCKPVDCDLHYNGYKPLFDNKTKRCVRAVDCLTNTNKILNPHINKCVDNSINTGDIQFVKSLTKNQRKAKDILIIRNAKKLAASVNDTQLINTKIDTNNFKEGIEIKNMSFLKKVKAYFSCNKYTFSILGLVIFVQCVLICSMLYFVTKSCGCRKKKMVERKYFNYRQDASVTTPLIDTSNIDTETTDYQYLSEYSDIDKKIKCYKACQKERKNNVKLSLSDDILSKCINRRDWTKPRSETIPELPKEEDFRSKDFKKSTIVTPEKIDDVKIIIENNIEQPKSNAVMEDKEMTTVKSIVKIIENKNDTPNLQRVSSEKEIKCHSYNYNEANSNLTGFKPSTHSKNLGFFNSGKEKKGTISLSTEKGAQATFSNDSIDDFLSERGVVYLAGENMSKYSFSSSSNPIKSSSTSISSRTSKNNVVKNVLSLLKRKSKVTSSDPILKKSKQSIDLELIHMSRASVFSSSNDTDCKGFKRLKDSRTSL